MSAVLSKGEFRNLALLRSEGIEIMTPRSRQRYDVIEAYDLAIDRMLRAEADRESMLRDIRALVSDLPINGKVPKVRIVLVGLMLPWLHRVFAHIKNLCRHVE